LKLWLRLRLRDRGLVVGGFFLEADDHRWVVVCVCVCVGSFCFGFGFVVDVPDLDEIVSVDHFLWQQKLFAVRLHAFQLREAGGTINGDVDQDARWRAGFSGGRYHRDAAAMLWALTATTGRVGSVRKDHVDVVDDVVDVNVVDVVLE